MKSILKISEAASLALHAMVILASKKEHSFSVKEIAELLKASANHLSKVLQRLSKAELVESLKGSKGGFKLSKNPEEITLMDIYEAIEGKFNVSSCLFGKVDCDSKCCVMGGLLSSINQQTDKHFRKTRLSDFLDLEFISEKL